MATYLSQLSLVGPLALTACIVLLYIASHRLARGRCPTYRHVALISATVLYAAVIGTLFLLPRSLEPAKTAPHVVLQLVPAQSIASGSPIGTIGNLAAFIPLPALVYAHTRSLRATGIVGIAAPALIEPTQLLIDVLTRFPNFVVDIDDLMLQVAGGAIGVALVALARHGRAAHAE